MLHGVIILRARANFILPRPAENKYQYILSLILIIFLIKIGGKRLEL